MIRASAINLLAGSVAGLGALLGAWAAPAAPGVRVPAPPTSFEIDAVADMVCREARGETTQGQMAVAYVALNRQRSTLFPATLAGVLQQPGQFYALGDSAHDAECQRGSVAWLKAKRATSVALTDGDQNHGGTFFDRCATAPRWMREKDLKTVIGKHCFWGESDVAPR